MHDFEDGDVYYVSKQTAVALQGVHVKWNSTCGWEQ